MSWPHFLLPSAALSDRDSYERGVRGVDPFFVEDALPFESRDSLSSFLRSYLNLSVREAGTRYQRDRMYYALRAVLRRPDLLDGVKFECKRPYLKPSQQRKLRSYAGCPLKELLEQQVKVLAEESAARANMNETKKLLWQELASQALEVLDKHLVEGPRANFEDVYPKLSFWEKAAAV